MKPLTLFRYISLVIVLLSMHSINACRFAEITSLQDEAVTKNEVKALKPLCALDVDFTIACTTHPATDPDNFQKDARLFMKGMAEEKLNIVDSMFATEFTEQQLVEPNVKDALIEINSFATVVGLTARYSGDLGGINMEEHTLAMLESFDASFKGSTAKLIFDDMPDHWGSKPVLNNSILFCNGERDVPVKRPQVLEVYIKTNGIPYAKIIVVDDTIKHLTDCGAYFFQMPGVEFQGFHYLKAACDKQREGAEEDFIAYLDRLIGPLKPTIS